MGVAFEVVPIPVRYKAHVRGSMKLSMAPIPLIKCDRASDAKLDGESYGMQSGHKLASYALANGQYDEAAKLMVAEWWDAKLGLSRQVPIISISLIDNSYPEGYQTVYAVDRGNHGRDVTAKERAQRA